MDIFLVKTVYNNKSVFTIKLWCMCFKDNVFFLVFYFALFFFFFSFFIFFSYSFVPRGRSYGGKREKSTASQEKCTLMEMFVFALTKY